MFKVLKLLVFPIIAIILFLVGVILLIPVSIYCALTCLFHNEELDIDNDLKAEIYRLLDEKPVEWKSIVEVVKYAKRIE